MKKCFNGPQIVAKLRQADALEHGKGISTDGSMLRELHAILRKEDAGFGGLERVQNNRKEFIWVHPKHKGLYKA